MGSKYTGTILVLLGIFPNFTACHRPLTVPNPVPRYLARPLKSNADLEQFLKEYGKEAVPVVDTSPERLSPLDVSTLAANNHPEVAAARARVSEARARLSTAGAWPNPEWEGRVLFDLDGRVEGEGALLFTVPLGGRIGAAEEQALAELDLAWAHLLAARRRASLQADRLMGRLALAEARLALLESLAKRSRQYASLAKSRQAASMADSLDVALVLADAAGDRRAVARARAEVDSIKQELRLLAGLAPDQSDFAAPPLARIRITESEDELVREALNHRPELMQARLEVVLADRRAARAAAERAPDLQLGPAVEAREDSVAFGFMLAIPLPLLQTGSGPYQEALAARQGARAAYWQATREAVSRVRDGLNRFKSLQNELDELIGEAAGALEGALEVAEARYGAGKLDVLRLLSVHRAFAGLKLDYLDLLLALHDAHVDLELATGGWVKAKEVAP